MGNERNGIGARLVDLQAQVAEAELEIGMLKQAYEELRRAIPVQALTNILDYLDDTNYPEYWDQQAVIALLDRVREM